MHESTNYYTYNLFTKSIIINSIKFGTNNLSNIAVTIIK